MRTLVVIPTYNELDNITRMLDALGDSVPGTDILVVDDSSPDGTAAAVEAYASTHPTIHLLSRPPKSGLGGAYRAGFRWGLDRGYDHFVEMDADFSHDPRQLPTLLAAAESGAELVIGSRYVAGGEIPKWSWHRTMLSKGGNLYASAVLGLKVKDATAGFRVYADSALAAIAFEEVTQDGYGFQVEMTDRARQAGVRIVEVPIRFIDREVGESKMSTAIVIEAFAMVARRGLKRRFRR